MTTDRSVQQAVTALQQKLAENLHSVCLYGSTVRGNDVPGVSDINLLIVLRDADPAAHSEVAAAIGANPRIDPFILSLPGFERNVRAFASKFASIRRHYRVLHGADPLAGIEIAPELERFLCEQGLRNLSLRLTRAFVTRKTDDSYIQFLTRSVTPLFLRLSEVLRLEGIGLPQDFGERIGPLSETFSIDRQTLVDLLALKAKPPQLSGAEAAAWHRRIFVAVNTAIEWLELRWPAKPLSPG